MDALSHAEPSSMQTFDQAVLNTAADLRSLVRRLQRPRVGDATWMSSVRERCQDLSERFAALKGSGGDATQGRFHDIREALVRISGELAGRPSVQRLGQFSASLSNHYEDLVEHMRKQTALAKAAEELRPIRLIRPWRTALHIGLGLSCFVLYQFLLTRSEAFVVLGVFVLIFGGLEVSRRFSKRWNDFLIDHLFGLIARPRERYKTNSASYFLLGLLLSCWLAPKEAVLAGVLILAFADPVASLVGSRWGNRKLYQDKSIVGSTAFFVTSFLLAFGYLALASTLSIPGALGIAAVMAVAGTIAELFGGHVDDNLSIPVVSALSGALFL